MPPTMVRATLTYTQQAPPSPVTVAKYSYDLMRGGMTGSVIVEHTESPVPVSPVDFLLPPPATGYTVRGRTLDAQGVDLAPPQTSPPFDIGGVQITVIGAVTVQVL